MSTTTISEWQARLEELLELKRSLVDRINVHVEDCDDCHASALTIIDPQTIDCGDFALCEKCVASRITAVKKRIHRMKESQDA